MWLLDCTTLHILILQLLLCLIILGRALHLITLVRAQLHLPTILRDLYPIMQQLLAHNIVLHRLSLRLILRPVLLLIMSLLPLIPPQALLFVLR